METARKGTKTLSMLVFVLVVGHASMAFGLLLAPRSSVFVTLHVSDSRLRNRNSACFWRLAMGLYDKSLPPRPPPRPGRNNKPKNNGLENREYRSFDSDAHNADADEEDDEDVSELLSATPLLFSFDPETGREVNDLLPPLGRSLTSGVECYFEPSDRLVVNLVGKASCSFVDACWALEACKGDLTEAWTCISTARRIGLNANRLPIPSHQTDEEDTDWDEDSYEIEMEEEYERLKVKRLQQERMRNVKDFFTGGKSDQNWLPKINPRPVDDEPWFTG